MGDHWESTCPKSEDGRHCECWYDGAECCHCGDPAVDYGDGPEYGYVDDLELELDELDDEEVWHEALDETKEV